MTPALSIDITPQAIDAALQAQRDAATTILHDFEPRRVNAALSGAVYDSTVRDITPDFAERLRATLAPLTALRDAVVTALQDGPAVQDIAATGATLAAWSRLLLAPATLAETATHSGIALPTTWAD